MAGYKIRSATFCSLFGFALFVMYPPVGWLPFGIGGWMLIRAIAHHRKLAAQRRARRVVPVPPWVPAYIEQESHWYTGRAPDLQYTIPPYQYLDSPTWAEIYNNTATTAGRKEGLDDS